MSHQDYSLTVGIIFLAVFVLHGLRIFYGWDAGINVWEVPMWASWIALVVSGYLSYTGLQGSGRLKMK